MSSGTRTKYPALVALVLCSTTLITFTGAQRASGDVGVGGDPAKEDINVRVNGLDGKSGDVKLKLTNPLVVSVSAIAPFSSTNIGAHKTRAEFWVLYKWPHQKLVLRLPFAVRYEGGLKTFNLKLTSAQVAALRVARSAHGAVGMRLFVGVCGPPLPGMRFGTNGYTWAAAGYRLLLS